MRSAGLYGGTDACGLFALTPDINSVRARDRTREAMARIAGVDIPREKQTWISLTYIHGVGRSTAEKICFASDVDPAARVRDLTDDEVAKIRTFIDQNLKVEGDLRRDISQNIKRKMDIGCYQGLRHRRGLPVHGQRTHTNARTRKGPRKTIANKKKVLK